MSFKISEIKVDDFNVITAIVNKFMEDLKPEAYDELLKILYPIAIAYKNSNNEQKRFSYLHTFFKIILDLGRFPNYTLCSIGYDTCLYGKAMTRCSFTDDQIVQNFVVCDNFLDDYFDGIKIDKDTEIRLAPALEGHELELFDLFKQIFLGNAFSIKRTIACNDSRFPISSNDKIVENAIDNLMRNDLKYLGEYDIITPQNQDLNKLYQDLDKAPFTISIVTGINKLKIAEIKFNSYINDNSRNIQAKIILDEYFYIDKITTLLDIKDQPTLVFTNGKIYRQGEGQIILDRLIGRLLANKLNNNIKVVHY